MPVVPPAPPSSPAPAVEGKAPPPPPPPPPGGNPPPPPPPKADEAPKAPEKAVEKAPEPEAKPAGESPAVKATTQAIGEPAKAGDKPTLRIVFKPTETTLPLSMKEEINKLAKQLIANESQRATLIAYAGVVGDQVSTARRISLSRALSVRAFLIDAGVNNMRINVQAEGDKNPGGEPDRVDIFVQATGDKSAP